MGIVNKNATVL